MASSVLLDLKQSRHQSRAEVGTVTQNLIQLRKHSLPIPRTAVITQTTLEEITQEAQLGRQLRTILNLLGFNKQKEVPTQKQQAQFIEQVKENIRHLRIPAKITYEIMDWYRQEPGFYRVTAANKLVQSDLEHQNVTGESNLIDSILTIWAEHLEIDFNEEELRLFAPPILIQAQGQPEMSGLALTQAPGSKTQLLFKSVWGVYSENNQRIKPDQFHYDLRTKQLTNRQLEPQAIKLQRALDKLVQKNVLHYRQETLSLTDKQANLLGEMVATVKRLTFEKQVVNWFYQDGQFYITQVKPLSGSFENESQTSRRIIVKGHPVQAGIVAGEVLVAQEPNQLKDLNRNHILVLKKFDSRYQKALDQVTAIVTDQDLTNPMLSQQIKKLAIPTIINTKQATLQLKNGQEILVDANAGQVLEIINSDQIKPTNLAPPTPTITKVYISAGNPLKAEDYLDSTVDGVGVLRSEYTLAKIGVHPLHLIRSHQKKKLEYHLKKAIQAFREVKPNLPVIYRSQNLTSQELSMLDRAGGYEVEETNPYLGFRGGMQLVRRFEFLDSEVSVIQQLLAENPAPLGLMLPFVRTPNELKLIVKHLKQKFQLFQENNFSLYLQLNTPANIWQLESYLKNIELGMLTGISFDAHSLHALSMGIDPTNPELFSLYPYDFELMNKMLKHVMEVIHSNPNSLSNKHSSPKTIFHLEDHNLSLIELATELGFEAVTVKPSFAERVKTRIREIEANKFNQV